MSYNRHGKIIMGAAGYHAGIFDLKEMQRRTEIPYSTLRDWFTKDFGACPYGKLTRITRAAGMTDEEIINLFKERG